MLRLWEKGIEKHMATEFEIRFPGNNDQVDVRESGFVHSTDQRETFGGDNSGPKLFDLFSTSIVCGLVFP